MLKRLNPSWHSLSPRFFHGLVLACIVLCGAALRFRHLDWARGYYFQSDEYHHTIHYLLRLPASLNPYAVGPYTYGGFPLYLYSSGAHALSRITGDPSWVNGWQVTLVARTYAAAASTITIVLVYALWRRLGGVRVAWVSALAFAVSSLSVQYAHYGVVDTLLAFWLVLATPLTLEAWIRDRPIYWVAAGFVLGLAVATKTSGLVWALLPVVAACGRWAQTHNWRPSVSVLALGGTGAVLGVLMASSYYLLD